MEHQAVVSLAQKEIRVNLTKGECAYLCMHVPAFVCAGVPVCVREGDKE